MREPKLRQQRIDIAVRIGEDVRKRSDHEAAGKKTGAGADAEPQSPVLKPRARGGEECDHSARNRRRRRPYDRDLIVGRSRPVRRRYGADKKRDGTEAEGESE